MEDINLFWSTSYNDDCTPIKFNGVPFMLLNKRRYICHQGKDKDVKTKEKRKRVRQEQSNISEHYTVKSRKAIQPSKKRNCPAQFTVKKLLYFPDYEITPSSDTQYKRKEILRKFRKDLMALKVNKNKRSRRRSCGFQNFKAE